MKLSKRVKRIKDSPTLAVTAKAAQLRSEGKDIIGLGAGEPDFETPDHIKAAAKQAIDQGITRYTPVTGMPALKEAIANKFWRDNALRYTPSEIIVGVGGKQTIFNLVLSCIDSGDEVIIPAPYWVSYVDIVQFASGVPVIVSAGIDQAFKITPQQLEAAITSKTRLMFLNSPSNPCGAVYSLEELQGLGAVLQRYPDILVATDDMYEHVNLSGYAFANIANAVPDLKSRTVVLNGVSKAYAMTGWRIGYAAGPQILIRAMGVLQSQSTSNPTSISQVAAQAALEGPQDCIQPMLQAFRARHRWVVDALNALAGVHCLEARGAFYAFPDAQEAIARLYRDGVLSAETDVAFCQYLLEKAGVAVVPGSAFGAPGYFRLSFATDLATLQAALGRLEGVLGLTF